MIEQLRVRRRVAAEAEVGGRRHDAAAEQVLPDPVDENAGRQRIVWIDDRLCQFQPAAAIDEWFTFRTGEAFEKLSRHDGPEVIRVAALKDARRDRRRR